jgi:NitT/TauT family transport system substrate-binding protein
VRELGDHRPADRPGEDHPNGGRGTRRRRGRPVRRATTNFPVGWYVVTKAWAKKYPRTLEAFLAALQQGQEIADTDRSAVEQAMEKLPATCSVAPQIAAVMSLENYPLSVAPDVDLSRVRRVADAMFEFHMLSQPFHVSTMLN